MHDAMSDDALEPQADSPGEPAQSDDASGSGSTREHRIPWMRDDIELYVDHPGGTSVRLPAATSDIGRGGIGLTTQTFLHIGTKTKLRLPGHDGRPVDTRGEVVWCNYNDGVHHSGIKFLDNVQLERIVPRDQWTPAMLSDETQKIKGKVVHLFASPLDQHILTVAMRDTLIRVTPVDSTGAALDTMRLGDTDILVIDLRNEQIDFAEFHESLNQAAWGGPIVFFADNDDEVMAARCIFGEPKGVLMSPIEGNSIANRLTEVLQEWQRLSGGEDAVTTKLRRDDAVAHMLDGYHDACKNAAEAIRAKIGKNDAEGIQGLLRRVAGTAGTFGYPALGKQADAALQRLNKGESLQAIGSDLSQVRTLLRNLRGFPEKTNRAA